MKVPFAGRAFPKVAGGHTRGDVWVLKALQLECVGGACGVGDLGRERGGDGVLLFEFRDA